MEKLLFNSVIDSFQTGYSLGFEMYGHVHFISIEEQNIRRGDKCYVIFEFLYPADIAQQNRMERTAVAQLGERDSVVGELGSV